MREWWREEYETSEMMQTTRPLSHPTSLQIYLLQRTTSYFATELASTSGKVTGNCIWAFKKTRWKWQKRGRQMEGMSAHSPFTCRLPTFPPLLFSQLLLTTNTTIHFHANKPLKSHLYHTPHLFSFSCLITCPIIWSSCNMLM